MTVHQFPNSLAATCNRCVCPSPDTGARKSGTFTVAEWLVCFAVCVFIGVLLATGGAL